MRHGDDEPESAAIEVPLIYPEAGTAALYREDEPPGLPRFDLIIRLIDADGEHDRALVRDAFTIGSDPADTFQLNSPGVEARHVRGSRLNCGVVLEQKSASSTMELIQTGGQRWGGTFVEHAQLYVGDRVRIGEGEVEILLDSAPPPPGGDFHGIVGRSRPAVALYTSMLRLAHGKLPLLITGPTGTGKEGVARAIHARSQRASGPFVVVNCGALKSNLISDELFGHEKHGFTDAKERRAGVFERAHGGTVFLDEIGEMPHDLQVDLLRVVEYGTLQRIGGSQEVEVDVRIVAATHVSLEQRVKEGRFREDLLHRLQGGRLTMPTLAERRVDVPRLVQHFMRKHADDGSVFRITGEALEALFAYPFPGNIRELEMMIRSAMQLCAPRREIKPVHLQLPQTAAAPQVGAAAPRRDTDQGLLKFFDRTEADIIDEVRRRTIERFGGNKTAAAKSLGISRSTLKGIND